jgi:hypothetical protein
MGFDCYRLVQTVTIRLRKQQQLERAASVEPKAGCYFDSAKNDDSKNIRPRVRYHSGPQAFSPESE